MATTVTGDMELGAKAPDFALPDPKGKLHKLADAVDAKAFLVVFMCNHCPYVKTIIDRLIRDANDLKAAGVNLVAIGSNDAATYPEDGPEAMRRWALEKRFPFPYLHDATQSVARAYDAACTPDFFGFNSELRLQYRGRLDDSGRSPNPAARSELLDAMRQIAATGQGPREQTPSIGCSIKWKARVAPLTSA